MFLFTVISLGNFSGLETQSFTRSSYTGFFTVG